MTHFAGAINNKPFVKYNRQQEYKHPSFQWNPPPQNKQMHQNRNTQYNGYQHGFNNSEQHWCETCDRGFKTLQQLEGHKQQHQKCNIDGCQFVAHPKVITKHIQMQHSSGLYKRIAKLDNPEEIKKWIQERKKKYPTKENIERKSAETKEKIERGEKMGLCQGRFQKNDSKGFSMKRKNNYNDGCNNHKLKRHVKQNNFDKSNHLKDKSKIEALPKNINTIAFSNQTRKLRPFAGIQNMYIDSDSNEEIEQLDSTFDIEYDDCETLHSIEEVKTEKMTSFCGALTSLMCNYGSSDEENTEAKSKSIQEEDNLTIKDNKDTKYVQKINTPKVDVNDKSDDDSGPEEATVVKVNEDLISNKSAANINVTSKPAPRRNIPVKENKRSHIRPKPKVPSTLLQKLLQKEVRHERNVILQCVRHIVKNNYFEN